MERKEMWSAKTKMPEVVGTLGGRSLGLMYDVWGDVGVPLIIPDRSFLPNAKEKE
jgi:hypothetical protein